MATAHSISAATLLLLGATTFGGTPAAGQDLVDENLHIQQVEFQETQPTPEEATEILLDRMEDGEQRALLSSYLLTDFASGGNFAVVNQEGDRNVAELVQIGLSNLALMQQTGSDNVTTLDQYGNNNIFGAWLSGDNNALDVVQDGNENVYLLEFVGDGLNHSFKQIGDGNSAYQIGVRSQPFSIEQRGSGMEIRIEHFSAGP